MNYCLPVSSTLSEMPVALQNFWKRDFKSKRCVYTLSTNMEVLWKEYGAVWKEDSTVSGRYIVFPNQEEFVRFNLRWS